MKNLKRIFVLFAIIFYSLTGFAQKDIPSEIAKYHNEILETLISNNKDSWKKMSKEEIELKIVEIMNKKKIDYEGFDEVKLYLDSKLFNHIKGDFEDMKFFLDHLNKEKLIGDTLTSYLNSIYEDILNNKIEQSLQKIEKLRSAELNNTDSINRDVFIKTWDASHEFWSNYEVKWSWGWQDTAVVFSDAVGGLLGFCVGGGATGGLGAAAGGFFGGAFASALVGSLISD